MEKNANDLTCKELVELVTEYFEGTLSPADQARFAKHLAVCIWCGAYLEQMRITVRTLGKLTEELIPLKAKEDLLEIFREWKKG